MNKLNQTLLRVSAALVVAALCFSMFAVSGGAAAQGNPTPDPNAACGRTLANFVRLLVVSHKFQPQANPAAPDYCANLEKEANTFTEATLLGKLSTLAEVGGESRDAFAFMDFAARKFVGVMPKGTPFTAVARNALPGSKMMLVKGEGFTVYVDYTFTDITEDSFSTLPDYRDYDKPFAPFCKLDWCQEPTAPPTSSRP